MGAPARAKLRKTQREFRAFGRRRLESERQSARQRTSINLRAARVLSRRLATLLQQRVTLSEKCQLSLTRMRGLRAAAATTGRRWGPFGFSDSSPFTTPDNKTAPLSLSYLHHLQKIPPSTLSVITPLPVSFRTTSRGDTRANGGLTLSLFFSLSFRRDSTTIERVRNPRRKHTQPCVPCVIAQPGERPTIARTPPADV